MKKVVAIIPCYNEESGIAKVIDGFPYAKLRRHGYELSVTVIDNNSSDNTSTVAKAAGATVIFEPKQGKGNAIRTGFYSIDKSVDYIVMLDGDDTYKASEIERLLEPIHNKFAEVIIGSRLSGNIHIGSMKSLNKMGNWVYSHLVRYSYRVSVTDVLTGYFAWTRKAIEELRPHLVSQGFAIEMEMITKMAKLGHKIYSVPITYESREGQSSLNPIRDGARILAMYARNLRWSPVTVRPQPMKTGRSVILKTLGRTSQKSLKYSAEFGERLSRGTNQDR